jgi:biopolymer transport protein ExbB
MRAMWIRRALFGILWLGALPALAQAPAAGVQKQSLLKIIREGIEYPTFLILAGSVVVIAFIIEHFLTVRRAAVAPVDQIDKARAQIEARNFRDCLESLRQSRTYFAQIMTAALQHARHGFDAMHEAALEKSGQLSSRMFRKAEYLNIIGNLGPLLGLLGTVWGMIEAFGELGAGGGQGGSQLAGGISKALVNTLLGLSLAILGIGFYGLCRNRIEAQTVGATVEALDLLEYFRPGPTAAKPTAAPPPAASVAPPRPPAPPPRGSGSPKVGDPAE